MILPVIQNVKIVLKLILPEMQNVKIMLKWILPEMQNDKISFNAKYQDHVETGCS